MSIRTKLFDKGKLVEEQMVRFLIKLDKRVSDLEESGSTDSQLVGRVEALEELDIDTRLRALEHSE